MQQERSFLRRLCFCEFGFTSKKHNARRAYNSIRLAVKTSRPQKVFLSYQKLFRKSNVKLLGLKVKGI